MDKKILTVLTVGVFIGSCVWQCGFWDFLEPVIGMAQLAVVSYASFEALVFFKKNASAMEKKTYEITLGLRAGYDAGAREYGRPEVVSAIKEWGTARLNAGQLTLQYSTVEDSLIYPVRNGLADGQTPYMSDEPALRIAGVLSPKYDKVRTDGEVLETLQNLAGFLGKRFEQKRVYISYLDVQYTVDIQ